MKERFRCLRRQAGSRPRRTAEAHGPAVDAPKRFARAHEVGFCGPFGIEPGALHTLDGVVIAGNGGDQCREAVDAVITSMDEIGMKP